jgi:hypothetical protein
LFLGTVVLTFSPDLETSLLEDGTDSGSSNCFFSGSTFYIRGFLSQGLTDRKEEKLANFLARHADMAT